jgi:hypothetical protein
VLKPSAPDGSRFRAHLLPAALLLAAAGWIYGRSLLHPLTDLPFYVGDGTITVWNYWWAKKALIDLGTSPFATSMLTHPHTTSLFFHSHDLLHGVFTIPFQLLLEHPHGLVLGVNVVLFGCLWLSAFAAYLCAWSETHDRFASLAAGVGYGFCAFWHSSRDMPVWGAMYWLPLFVLALRAALVERAVAWTAAPALILLLASFQSLYYVAFLGLVSALAIGIHLARTRFGTRALARALGVVAALGLALAPIATLALVDLRHNVYASALRFASELDALGLLSIDLAGLVIPDSEQGWWRFVPGVESWNQYGVFLPWWSFASVRRGRVAYVGVLTLILAAYGARGQIRGFAPLWLALAGASLLLALGPYLHVWGREFRSPWLPMPYRLLFALSGPFGRMFRSLFVFVVPLNLGLWMLAAHGVTRLRARWRAGAPRTLAAALALWLIAEHAYAPGAAFTLQLTPGLAAIARDPRAVSVLEIPADNYWAFTVYGMYQAQHEKPIARGHVARLSDTVTARDRQLAGLAESPAALEALLSEMRPVYVVVHPGLLTKPRDRRVAKLVETRLAKQKIYEDGAEIVYAPEP